jgi:peptidoglycan/LPS O-acetylase OafA/YrhL
MIGAELMSQQEARFVVLDGFRGIAAISVVAFHISLPLHFPNIATHAYLAVDFFFLLSGLVIDRAYFGRLLSPGFRPEFLIQRLIRLYPMIVAGMLLGACVSGAKMLATHSMDVSTLGIATILGLVLLPFAKVPPSGFAFPLDGPLWSLFYEAVVNVAYTFMAPLIKPRRLLAIIIVAAAALVLIAFRKGDLEIGSGGNLGNFAGGIARVFFSFFAGVLISRQLPSWSDFVVPSWLSPLALLAILMVPQIPMAPIYDLVCILFLFPAILVCGANNKASGRTGRVYEFLGALSYPLYAIHYPVMRVFLFAQEKYGLHGVRLGVSAAVEMICCLAAGTIAMRLYDEPVRAWLRNLRMSAAAGAPAH